jgi:hypothetical protein
MITARVISTFIARGKTIGVGRIIKVAEADLPKLSGLVEVLSPADLKIQQDASDFVRLCMHHENTYPDGHCPVKHDRLDPMTACKIWQLKNGRVIH